MNLSAIVLARNEEKNLPECLKRLEFADEIVVIDDNSSDRTAVIARQLGARVLGHSLNEDFAAQRNFALEEAKGEWVLFIDADERVSPELKEEILGSIANAKGFAGFNLRRSDFLWGKLLTHGESGRTVLLRLVKKGAGKWQRKVHEVWQIEGKSRTLQNPLFHYAHPNLSAFIARVNHMSSLHAEANRSEGKRSGLFRIIFWPIGKFIRNYFLHLGFLDGTAGFVAALMMSLHSFLSWSKLWFLQESR